KSQNCDPNSRIVIKPRKLRRNSATGGEPKTLKLFSAACQVLIVCGVIPVGEKSVSDDWKQIGLGGTGDQFLGEMIDRYREMMFRTARRITQNDYDADDVIQRLCVRFVIGGIPAGLRENPPAFLIGCIVNEAKNVHRTRERRRIDENIDLPEVSAPLHCTME